MRIPKMLYLDIEMAPNLGCIWGLFKNHYIPHEHIVSTGYTLCIAYSWWGEEKTHFLRVADNTKESRKQFIEQVRELLHQADVVIHYNGSRYDIPALIKDIFEFGLKPPSNFKQLDLFREMKQFKFLSHKLGYITERLGLARKGSAGGMETWLGCMNNDPQSWELMRKYNIQDVEILKELHVAAVPWIRSRTFNFNQYSGGVPVCPHCGVLHNQLSTPTKLIYHKKKVYEEYACTQCHGVYSTKDF